MWADMNTATLASDDAWLPRDHPGKFQLLAPAPPYYPYPGGRSILGVMGQSQIENTMVSTVFITEFTIQK